MSLFSDFSLFAYNNAAFVDRVQTIIKRLSIHLASQSAWYALGFGIIFDALVSYDLVPPVLWMPIENSFAVCVVKPRPRIVLAIITSSVIPSGVVYLLAGSRIDPSGLIPARALWRRRRIVIRRRIFRFGRLTGAGHVSPPCRATPLVFGFPPPTIFFLFFHVAKQSTYARCSCFYFHVQISIVRQMLFPTSLVIVFAGVSAVLEHPRLRFMFCAVIGHQPFPTPMAPFRFAYLVQHVFAVRISQGRTTDAGAFVDIGDAHGDHVIAIPGRAFVRVIRIATKRFVSTMYTRARYFCGLVADGHLRVFHERVGCRSIDCYANDALVGYS